MPGARRGPRDPRKSRTQLHLTLSPAEIRQLERWAERELRSVSNLVSYLVAEHLRARRRPGPMNASPGKRRDYSSQVWLTAKQRQELGRRAKAAMRTPGNYVTAVVLGALGGG